MQKTRFSKSSLCIKKSTYNYIGMTTKFRVIKKVSKLKYELQTRPLVTNMIKTTSYLFHLNCQDIIFEVFNYKFGEFFIFKMSGRIVPLPLMAEWVKFSSVEN